MEVAAVVTVLWSLPMLISPSLDWHGREAAAGDVGFGSPGMGGGWNGGKEKRN